MIPRWLIAPAALVALAPLFASSPARAESERAFDVRAGRLSERGPDLARQAGISISVSDPELWRARVPAVKGRMAPREALLRLLRGTRARAVRLSETSWRIEPAAGRPAAHQSHDGPPPPGHQFPPPEEAPAVEIVVTASKIDAPAARFAGTVRGVSGEDIAFGGERGTDSILARMATVSSTHLGSGRNKLFIRGIADSSFTGPTQSTVGQYLGDVRLSYNAPDPDLRLYDVGRVEVLEGPQGTLYGAGSLGGIIRLVPNAPQADIFAVNATAGASATQHGDPGGDIAATLNLPLSEDGHALRLTGYGISEGGYIDNPVTGQNDINRTRIGGGRATLRLYPLDGWTVDVGGIYQRTVIEDAQYTDRDTTTPPLAFGTVVAGAVVSSDAALPVDVTRAPPLTRASQIVENADATYGMATLVIARDWGDLRFQTSNAYVWHDLAERFDATIEEAEPRVFDQNNRTRIAVSETRVWRPFTEGYGWVVGFSALDNRTRLRRELVAMPVNASATGVANDITEFTVYGEASIEVLPRLLVTGGARWTHAELSGAGEDVALAVAIAGRAVTASRKEEDLLPSLAVLWSPVPDLQLYARYQESFRPGGLAIEQEFVRRFRSDRVTSYEAGARYWGFDDRVELSLSVAHTDWRDIQADFIDGNGFPSTANIGDGRITSIAGTATLRLFDGLSFDIGAVYNESDVTELSAEILPVFAAAPARLGQIPNVANHAVHGAFDYRVLRGEADLRVNGWANYVGPSRLGIGPVLGAQQGDYVDTGLAARIGDGRRGVSLTITNLFDARGNRFALGTPFVGGDVFTTPLRPRTIRIGLDWAL